MWGLFPSISIEGPGWLTLPQKETEMGSLQLAGSLLSLLPTPGCAQGTETFLSAAPGPARQSRGGWRKPQKEALDVLPRQSCLIHSFTDHLLSTCCVHGTDILWEKFKDSFRHELSRRCRGGGIKVINLAPLSTKWASHVDF